MWRLGIFLLVGIGLTLVGPPMVRGEPPETTTVVVRAGVKIQEFRRSTSPTKPPVEDEPRQQLAAPLGAIEGWQQRFVWNSRREPPLDQVVREDQLPSFRPRALERSDGAFPSSKPRLRLGDPTQWAELPSFPLHHAVEALAEPSVTPSNPAWPNADAVVANPEPLRADRFQPSAGSDSNLSSRPSMEASRGEKLFNPFGGDALPEPQMPLASGGESDNSSAGMIEHTTRESDVALEPMRAEMDNWRFAWHRDSSADQELGQLERPMASLSVDISEEGPTPDDVAAVGQWANVAGSTGLGDPRHGGVMFWEAPGTMHQPLYFENVNLERAGHSWGVLQPAMSAVHFFGRIPALPYLLAAHPHKECVYTLGHYRPGSCAPLLSRTPRVSAKAGLVQAGAITGLIFLVP